MAGARGDALDWALALARAPGERLVLRQRPLPEGIDALLQIAAGHRGEALSSAVSRSGETEQGLVEAVRFYLREVLFHSGADAYRILGLERGASAEQIKGHHRWLQQWLHPDRHTSDWDAIFAGRVNAAWNQLRNEERRRAYDAEPATERAPTAIPQSPVMAGWAHPSPPPDSPRERWQRRLPLLALLVACLGLGVMALRDLARDEALLVAAPAGSAQPRMDDPRERGDATLDPFGNLHIPERGASSVRKPGRATTAAPRQPRRIDRRNAAGQASPGANPRVPLREPADPIRPVDMQPRVASDPVARALPQTPAVDSTPAAVVPPAQASAEMPVPQQTPSPVQPPPPATAAVAVAPAAPRPTAAPLSAERVRQAQLVGDRLVAFMGRPGGAIPPIWDSPAAQQGAQQLRDAMLADGRPVMAQADWRVGESEARMRVAIRHADGRQGHLDAVLVWREQRWLVRRLSMERDW